MKITITNPHIHRIGKGYTLGIPLNIANDDQIKDIIRKLLLKNSIIADNIQIDRKFIGNIDRVKSAQELLEETWKS